MLKHAAQPATLEERLHYLREARRTLGTEIPWLCDPMENGVAHALGGGSNAEFLIDPEGRVMNSRPWCDPDALRKDLERLVGPVENPTSPTDVSVESHAPHIVIRDGIMRLSSPTNRQPLPTESLPD